MVQIYLIIFKITNILFKISQQTTIHKKVQIKTK